MANRQLVDLLGRHYKSGIICLLFLAISTVPFDAISHDHGKIRIYKLNKKGQLARQKWLKDVDQAGCHNTFKSRQVHRFSQIGYKYCTIYSEENCNGGSELSATWQGKKLKKANFEMDVPQTQLIPGSDWFLHIDGNLTIKSWFCAYDPN
jgi:hypothetical protein